MKEMLDQLLKQLANFATIDQLKKLESTHQATLDKHTKDISKLFELIRNLPKPEKVTNTIAQQESITNDNANKSQFDFDALQKQIDALRRGMDDKFNQVYKMLDLKADKSELDLLERRLTDFIRSFMDRFADKKDVAKKLAQMDAKINALLEMIMN